MWKLGKILGIDVSLHWSLLLLIGLTAVTGGGTMGALLFAAVFACVLLHELGHSMAARQFGIETHSIVLLPIGGIASLERMPRHPLQELWIAVAGPLVNVVIAFVLFLAMPTSYALTPSYGGFFTTLMFANISLVLFNLLPAFPMDGGRILRSLLAMRLSFGRATEIAARCGRYVAVGLGILGLFYGHIMLMLVAAFVYFAGSAEARMVAEEDRRETMATWRNGFVRSFNDAKTYTSTRAGEVMHVIWDEDQKKYRYAAR